MGTGYQLLVLLHLVCVVGGFGALAYNGLYLSLGRRQGAGLGRLLEVNGQVSGLAELLVYAAFIFGLAAVGASHSTVKFSQGWVSAAFGLYLVDIGILHGWIRRHQRLYRSVVGEIELAVSSGAQPTGAAPPQVARLEHLERRITAGWGGFNVVVVVVMYLMVFKPGS